MATMKIFYLFVCLFVAVQVNAATLPTEVKAAMKSGAISLSFETRSIGPNGSPIGLHLFVVPVGRNTESIRNMGTTPPTGPIRREEIQDYDVLKPSPFTLEVFAKSNSRWQRINSVTFSQTKNVQKIVTRWLYPKQKTGPVIMLHFGYTHWHEWEVITFAKGLRSPATHQTFLWGGEGEYDYVSQKFDQTNAAGKMIIIEENSEGVPDGKNREKQRLTKNIYRYNGREWLNNKAHYFVIGATLKTRAEADKALAKLGFGEVRPSAYYKGLQPGYYVLILGRYSDLKRAQEQVNGLKENSKIDVYVKKAF
jgi:hypothetical protein